MSALTRIIEKIRTRLHPKTIVATANTEIPYADALYGGVRVSNRGATGAVVFALPPANVGMTVEANVLAAQALRLDPNGNETVALPTGVQQGAGKYIGNSTIGSTIKLVVLVKGQWDVQASNGTFAAEA